MAARARRRRWRRFLRGGAARPAPRTRVHAPAQHRPRGGPALPSTAAAGPGCGDRAPLLASRQVPKRRRRRPAGQPARPPALPGPWFPPVPGGPLGLSGGKAGAGDTAPQQPAELCRARLSPTARPSVPAGISSVPCSCCLPGQRQIQQLELGGVFHRAGNTWPKRPAKRA